MAKKKNEPYVPKVPKDPFKLPDGQHSGYTNGFYKRGDRLELAPAHTMPANEIRLDRDALHDFVDAINRHVHGELRKLRRREDAWWASIERDLGVKREAAIYYYAGFLKRREKPVSVDAVDPHATSTGTPSTRE